MRKLATMTWMILLSVGMTFATQARAQVDAGIVLWRHATRLEVNQSRDFDGSDNTAEARARDWDVHGSGVGARVNVAFSPLASVFGTLGITQVTVRDEDLSNPNLNFDSRGFDDDFYFSVGARLASYFPSSASAFWSASASVYSFSSRLEERVDRIVDYDETAFMFGGSAGFMAGEVGLYGGLAVVWLSADLNETDLGNLPGLQLRTTDLERDGQIDLVLGAKAGTSPVTGFFEVGLFGTFSTSTGLAFEF